MSETRQLAWVVVAGLVLGLLTIGAVITLSPLFAGDLTVTSYDAVVSDDGKLTERYVYNV